MPKIIYGLFYREQGKLQYFYIGQTNNLERRLKEHEAYSARGREDKYVRIRQLDTARILWHGVEIEQVAETDYVPDSERWHVIRLTREGHQLTNMRHGSPAHLKELAEQVHAPHIRNAADVRDARKQRLQLLREFEESEALRRRILRPHWLTHLRDYGIPDVSSDTILPPHIKRQLLARMEAYGRHVWSLERGFNQYSLQALCDTPPAVIRQFRELEEHLIAAGHLA